MSDYGRNYFYLISKGIISTNIMEDKRLTPQSIAHDNSADDVFSNLE